MEISETAYRTGKSKRESVQLRRILALVIPLQVGVVGSFCLNLPDLKIVSKPLTTRQVQKLVSKASDIGG
jgi:hypothetical protein